MAPDSSKLLDRERLARLLGMLGSAHAGERDNAARLADRLVREAGITWHDVMMAAPTLPASPKAFDVFDRWPQHWRAAVHLCQAAPGTMLTPWERQFVATLSRYKSRPSDPQADILATITARVLAGGVP